MKKFIVCVLTLLIVFSGCSKTSETIHIDRYSREDLLNHKENVSSVTKESPNNDYSGDLKSGSTVFVTKTGKKYHTSACSFLKKSKTEITLEEAIKQNLTPCSTCNPEPKYTEIALFQAGSDTDTTA